MNSAIAEIIGGYITPLNWMDVWGGMSRTITTIIPNDDNRPQFRRFPVGCNTSLDECKAGTYQSLMPDSSKRAVAFFEDGGTRLIKRNGDNFEFINSMKLVVWVNLAKFKDPSCAGITSLLVASIIKSIPANFINSAPFTGMKIRLKGEDPKTPAIFARYTFSEPETQFLLFPFDYFALQFETEFMINQACATDVELATDDCI